jgi:hypothetical protein
MLIIIIIIIIIIDFKIITKHDFEIYSGHGSMAAPMLDSELYGEEWSA